MSTETLEKPLVVEEDLQLDELANAECQSAYMFRPCSNKATWRLISHCGCPVQEFLFCDKCYVIMEGVRLSKTAATNPLTCSICDENVTSFQWTRL